MKTKAREAELELGGARSPNCGAKDITKTYWTYIEVLLIKEICQEFT